MKGKKGRTLIPILIILIIGVQTQYQDPYANNQNPFVYQPWRNQQNPPQDWNQGFLPDQALPPNAVENFDYPVRPPQDDPPPPTIYHYDVATTSQPSGKLTPFFGGIIDGPMTLEKAKSPYLARDDVIIGPNGVLDVEPGVEVHFSPMVGITVRGIINARGTPEQRIKFTSADPPLEHRRPSVRLVDGPDLLSGRVQILHKNKWRSVCTNSKNWTIVDMETACRQMGFQGGSWWGWVDRETGPPQPRLLWQEPRCFGSEANLFDCQWSTRQLGSGVCDYHPDLGIKCLPNHASSTTVNHWRGIRFENAPFEKRLQRDNTLFVPVSQSVLRYVDVQYAGTGRDYNTTSALESQGVPPVMLGLNIAYSAYNGMNISQPSGPVLLTNSTVRLNRGYGVFINSTHGDVALVDTVVTDNGADGVRLFRSNPRLDDQFDRSDVHDFCMFPTTMSQTFPIHVLMEQGQYNPTPKECSKTFFTKFGQLLSVEVVAVTTDRNDSAIIEIYDGISETDRTLARFSVRNHTKLQAVTTTRNSLLVKFIAEPKAQVVAFVRLTSGVLKKYDMNVTGSSVVNNNGRGIFVEGLRSSLHVHHTSVTNNNHVAGIHVLRGSGDVNVTDSRIAFNVGDGLNVSYSGGSTNVTRSSFSSNLGYGVAVWLNDTKEPEYIAVHQETDVAYSEIFKNHLTGVLVGNFCGDSIVNITANWFNDSMDTALEVKSCWNKTNSLTIVQIGHNVFVKNRRLGIKISPALNMRGRIEYNHIMEHTHGGIFIKNPPKYEEEFNFDLLPTYLAIQFNEMQNNRGVFVVNIGLSPYSDVQRILFTRNFVRYNKIKEPFDGGDGFAEEGKVRLVPRSRVAAPVVISSSNVDVYRNIIQNHESRYEIGSHLEDQSKVINCTYNWIGYAEEAKIYNRLFHRKDRYNLASIVYMPYLLHSSNPATSTIIFNPTFVPQFWIPGSKTVGGEVDGIENLRAGEYFVERDINIRPGGRLTLQNGVTLRFPPSVGLMVAGRLEARGVGPNDILLTMKQERIEPVEPVDPEAVTEPVAYVEDTTPVRLLGGRNKNEGRLQVKVNDTWGTVCSYGWTMQNAALVCQQMGLVLNPADWELQRNEIPLAGTSEPVHLSNVRCTDDDYDVSQCLAETTLDFENTCTHAHDVGIRCHNPVWAGLRFGVLSEASTLQYVTVERAGLLDYATHAFKPAVQIDLARHSLENVRVVSNSHDGLGVIYSDLYSAGASNTIRNSEFSGNGGSGISFKQLGFSIIGSTLANNYQAGIRHDPAISKRQQQELAGWFIEKTDSLIYNPAFVPQSSDFDLDRDESRHIITQKVIMSEAIDRVFNVRAKPGFVIGMQLLNPISARSSEQFVIYDSQSTTGEAWDLRRDLTSFPTTSSSFIITIKYNSGTNGLGGAVLLVSSVPAPVQYVPNRIVRGAIPHLSLVNTKIRDNRKGIWASYYNRYIDEFGDHYLRQANETVRILNCDISHNKEEAIFVLAPYWNVHQSNISEITYSINSTLITDNGRGIFQFSRDLRQSNNLFHWFLHDNSLERNLAGGFEVSLPYVWQYNENFTHTLRFVNNTFRGNQDFGFVVDGHYASLNMSNNIFQDNVCRLGLISFQGMEKQLRMRSNSILKNIGNFMVEFKAESQSEILGYVRASFRYNVVKQNRRQSLQTSRQFQQAARTPTCVICFHGTQEVNVNHNRLGENEMDYELIAGVRTAKLGTSIDVSENWWGSSDIVVIKEKIFDFDDWNNHAIATFRPYLLEDDIDGTRSVSWETPSAVVETDLGGRIRDNLVLHVRDRPYVVRRDITVMPDATLSIAPGVVLEFEPNVGILVLGVLKAQGKRGYEIIMRPSSGGRGLPPPEIASLGSESIRLCTGGNCTTAGPASNHGFMEYYNKTTMQWVPVCDDRFTERNAQVVCRELGYDVLNVRFDLGPRVEFHPNSLTRIWSYPEPLQCIGNEDRFEECKVRLNGQQYNHVHRCEWNSNFVFVHCGSRNLPNHLAYWGGIRFANGEFEQNLFENRRHDLVTHETTKRVESILEYVNVTGAGILHNEKSPAVLAVSRSPQLNNLNISLSADGGISMISPSEHVRLLFNSMENNLGTGISIASLTGEGRESEESSFTPLRHVSIPYHVFSMVEMCDTTKEIIMEERILVYFKYDNFPVNCVKIFRSVYGVKPFGFRLLQSNLFNTSTQPGWPDSISLYDGNIYNVSAPLIATIDSESPLQKKLIRTTGPSLSIRLFAKGASSDHGFIAEVVTLPISAIGFNRDVQHNISYSVISNNERGAVWYQSAGEVNPTLTVQWNQFTNNCKQLYGNFTTCDAAMFMDVQNTQNFYFRNNLVKKNQGGLKIKSDSRGSATALKGWIYNNLWSENYNRAALHVEGRPGSAYQQITIYRNYFTRNYAPYRDTLVLRQVISNFTYNYVHDNRGAHILEVSGFEKVRLPYYQTTSHNGFYQNFALDRENRGTIVAGTAGQHYVDNVLFNPDNDYEIVTVNRSRSLEVWKTPIDAKHNWWGFNESLAVSGRVKDRSDHPDLLEVDFRPFLMNNRTILSGKCPPGWTQVGDTCYIYVGAPMSFHDAKLFCQEDNATMPYISGNYLELYHFLRSQQEHYLYYDRVWVQHIDRINQCTVFTYQRMDTDVCQRLNPFICEIDPKVHINFLNWRDDVVTVAIMGVIGAAFLFIVLIFGFWFSKSQRRKKQRLERRNSIRQSLRSLKSIGSTNGLSDTGYRRPIAVAKKPGKKTDDYNEMSGSLDSIEKSQYNSSIDDTQSYDIYEAHNPSLQPSYDLAYQNRGFRDNSTFASRDNNAESVSYYDDNTLPMTRSTDSILDMKRGLDSTNSFRPSDYYTHTPTPDTPDPYCYNPPAMQTYGDYNNSVLELSQARSHSQALLETNLDDNTSNAHLLPKAKSEAFLETNLDGGDLPEMGEALSLTNRSKSQPLETSM